MATPSLYVRNLHHSVNSCNYYCTVGALVGSVLVTIICLIALGLIAFSPHYFYALNMSKSLLKLLVCVIIPIMFVSVRTALSSYRELVYLSPSKAQKSFKIIENIFYNTRSQALKKTKHYSKYLHEQTIYLEHNKTISNSYHSSDETMYALNQSLLILPKMYSHLMNSISNNGFNSEKTIQLYTEFMDYSSLARNLALLTCLDIENGLINTNKLNDLLNPEINPLGELIFYPDVVSDLFEKQVYPLDPIKLFNSTQGFTQLTTLDIYNFNKLKTNIASNKVKSIKYKSSLSLTKLLSKIDNAKVCQTKLQFSWLFDLANKTMMHSKPLEYFGSYNVTATKLIYHYAHSKM